MKARLCGRRKCQSVAKLLKAFVASQIVLRCLPAAAEETKWRLVEPGDDGIAMLVMSDTDEANDAFGTPYFHCKPGSGLISVVETNMKDKALRTAIANLIVNDSYPTVQLEPGPERSVLEEITSSDAAGWGYRFQVGADDMAFNMFKTTGYFNFSIGSAAVHVGVKAGLSNISKFQLACRRQPGSRGLK